MDTAADPACHYRPEQAMKRTEDLAHRERHANGLVFGGSPPFREVHGHESRAHATLGPCREVAAASKARRTHL